MEQSDPLGGERIPRQPDPHGAEREQRVAQRKEEEAKATRKAVTSTLREEVRITGAQRVRGAFGRTPRIGGSAAGPMTLFGLELEENFPELSHG